MPICDLPGWEDVELSQATINSIKSARNEARLIASRFGDESDFNSLREVIATLENDLNRLKLKLALEEDEKRRKLQDPNHVVTHLK